MKRELPDATVEAFEGRRIPLARAELSVKWDLAEVDPTLWHAVSLRCPRVVSLSRELRDALRFPSTRRALAAPPVIRPFGHGRTFYIDLGNANDPCVGASAGCLAIKGSEAATDDYAEWVTELRSQRRHWGINIGDEFTSSRSTIDTMLNDLERWPIIERKVPGAVVLSEALAEASIARDVQHAHVGRYGQFARLPLPLLVLEWPSLVVDRVSQTLEPLLSKRSFTLVASALSDGLGVYIYYYPSLPIRLMSLSSRRGVQHDTHPLEIVQRLPSVRHNWTYVKRAEQLSRHINVSALITAWTDLLVRILALGFVPRDPGSMLTADCLQPWNAVLDGGYADIDSLARMADLDQIDIEDSVRRSVRGLITNISYLLLGEPALSTELRDRFPELTALIWHDVQARLAAQASSGGVPREISYLIANSDVHAALDIMFRSVSACEQRSHGMPT